MDEVAQDRADAELSRMIERRYDPRDGEALLEPSYAQSVSLYHERSEAEMRGRWIDFHRNMHRLHSTLADEHAQRAEALLCTEDRGEVRR